MKLLIEHLSVTFSFDCLGWFVSNDIHCVLFALIFGWLLDVDHLCDYLYYIIRPKKLNLNLVKAGQYFKINKKIIVPLRSWGVTAILLLLGIFTPEFRTPFISAAFAYAAHLLRDQWAYHVRFYGYSFISRMNSGFEYKGFCRGGNG